MSADRRAVMRGTLYGAPHAPPPRPRRRSHAAASGHRRLRRPGRSMGRGLERGLGSRRGPVVRAMLAEPAHGCGDAVLPLDPRLPAEELAGLLDRGPAALDVDGERGPVCELEGVRVLAAG